MWSINTPASWMFHFGCYSGLPLGMEHSIIRNTSLVKRNLILDVTYPSVMNLNVSALDCFLRDRRSTSFQGLIKLVWPILPRVQWRRHDWPTPARRWLQITPHHRQPRACRTPASSEPGAAACRSGASRWPTTASAGQRGSPGHRAGRCGCTSASGLCRHSTAGCCWSVKDQAALELFQPSNAAISVAHI